MHYLVLPAYNESLGLRALLEELTDQKHALKPLEVVIINDGSNDDTDKILASFQTKHQNPALHILKHKTNQGLGRALRTGLGYLMPKLNAHDVVFTMDADDTHPVSLMPRALKDLNTGFDIILFSRFVRGGKMIGVNAGRYLLGWGASWFYRMFCPFSGIRDFNCGYRAISGRLLKLAWQKHGEDLVQERGFAANAEILLKLMRLDAKVKEVPLVLRYDKKEGPSKMHAPITIKAHIRLVFRSFLGLS